MFKNRSFSAKSVLVIVPLIRPSLSLFFVENLFIDRTKSACGFLIRR